MIPLRTPADSQYFSSLFPFGYEFQLTSDIINDQYGQLKPSCNAAPLILTDVLPFNQYSLII
jgi:hypothetical protein